MVGVPYIDHDRRYLISFATDTQLRHSLFTN